MMNLDGEACLMLKIISNHRARAMEHSLLRQVKNHYHAAGAGLERTSTTSKYKIHPPCWPFAPVGPTGEVGRFCLYDVEVEIRHAVTSRAVAATDFAIGGGSIPNAEDKTRAILDA